MDDLASCWYNLLTKQRVCTGVKIKTTGDSKLNLSAPILVCKFLLLVC